MQHRHVGIEVELLEHHGGSPANQLGFVLDRQLLAVDVDMAAGRLFQEIHAPYGGGLARAGGADDDQLFALLHFQIDVLQHMQVAEIFVDVFQFDHASHPHFDFAKRKKGIFARVDPDENAFAFKLIY